tara:strand:+ start:1665 stop:2006 length:342 start_codon:yes stop_codon:yes gene_type:complete
MSKIKIKILISITIFSSLLIFTSIIKNQTREIEKKIFYLSKLNNFKNKDLNESQLDFYYLTSPSMIEKRVRDLNFIEYFPMDHSKIYLDISNFIELKKKFVNKNNNNEKKVQN